jgi:chondroitin AC lyase
MILNNVHYWNSDYTQHRCQGFLFSVRNVSARTVASETGNNENLKAHYLLYTANFLALKGDEYFNLIPV